jgi:hypothetical protein
MNKIEQEWRSYNKQQRRDNMHQCQFKTLEEYTKYKNGNLKYTQEFKTLEKKNAKYRRKTPDIIASKQNHKLETTNPTAKRKSPVYTGSLIKGICQTHKSNAVPVIDNQHIIDIGHMRR